MSHSEYMEWLIKIGCGWIGWTPQEVKEAHICDIMLAYDGVIDKLKACYGSGEDKEQKNKRTTSNVDVDSFDKFSGAG